MTTPNGWQGQNNPAQQAPSSASAHHPAGPAGYGAPAPGQGAPGTPQGYVQPGAQGYAPPKPKAPLDLGKILSLSGLGVLALAFVLLVVAMIVALVGTGATATGQGFSRGNVLLTTSTGLAIIGAGLFIGSSIQSLADKLKK
ncbi:MAG: hypothetical protein ACTII7_07960 [Galactobacter sp.]